MTAVPLLSTIDVFVDALLATLCFVLAIALAALLPPHVDRAFRPLVLMFLWIIVVSAAMYATLAAAVLDENWNAVAVGCKITLALLMIVCGFVFVRSRSSITGLQSRSLLERANSKLERLNAQFQAASTDAENARRELAVANEKLQAQTVTDALTDVANRRGFDARLAEALADCRRSGGTASLLMIDIDNFKKYNDTFGHPEGDACLRKVALAIRASVNRPRDFVARFGGEEFAVIMEGTDAAGAHFLAERICSAVADLDLAQGDGARLPFVSASIGIATASSATELVPDVLVFRADQALYAAKRAGGNSIVAAHDSIAVH